MSLLVYRPQINKAIACSKSFDEICAEYAATYKKHDPITKQITDPNHDDDPISELVESMQPTLSMLDELFKQTMQTTNEDEICAEYAATYKKHDPITKQITDPNHDDDNPTSELVESMQPTLSMLDELFKQTMQTTNEQEKHEFITPEMNSISEQEKYAIENLEDLMSFWKNKKLDNGIDQNFTYIIEYLSKLQNTIKDQYFQTCEHIDEVIRKKLLTAVKIFQYTIPQTIDRCLQQNVFLNNNQKKTIEELYISIINTSYYLIDKINAIYNKKQTTLNYDIQKQTFQDQEITPWGYIHLKIISSIESMKNIYLSLKNLQSKLIYSNPNRPFLRINHKTAEYYNKVFTSEFTGGLKKVETKKSQTRKLEIIPSLREEEEKKEEAREEEREEIEHSINLTTIPQSSPTITDTKHTSEEENNEIEDMPFEEETVDTIVIHNSSSPHSNIKTQFFPSANARDCLAKSPDPIDLNTSKKLNSPLPINSVEQEKSLIQSPNDDEEIPLTTSDPQKFFQINTIIQNEKPDLPFSESTLISIEKQNKVNHSSNSELTHPLEESNPTTSIGENFYIAPPQTLKSTSMMSALSHNAQESYEDHNISVVFSEEESSLPLASQRLVL